jgi:transposase
MTMIEASTRYLREWVDALYLELPFDTEIAGDFQGETEQRVKAMAGMKKKPAAFHILDSARAFAMVRKHGEVMSQVAAPEQGPVLPRAVDARVGAGGEGGLTV